MTLESRVKKGESHTNLKLSKPELRLVMITSHSLFDQKMFILNDNRLFRSLMWPWSPWSRLQLLKPVMGLVTPTPSFVD